MLIFPSAVCERPAGTARVSAVARSCVGRAAHSSAFRTGAAAAAQGSGMVFSEHGPRATSWAVSVFLCFLAESLHKVCLLKVFLGYCRPFLDFFFLVYLEVAMTFEAVRSRPAVIKSPSHKNSLNRYSWNGDRGGGRMDCSLLPYSRAGLRSSNRRERQEEGREGLQEGQLWKQSEWPFFSLKWDRSFRVLTFAPALFSCCFFHLCFAS